MALAKITLLVLTYGVLWFSCVFAISEPDTETSTSNETPINNFYIELESTKCADRYRKCTEELCYKIEGYRWKKRMRKICKLTCGYCRALSPPRCFSSEFGCCWDYINSALGPGGKGCPPCDDNQRYPNVCQRFQPYCRRKGISGKWMRGNCPDACGHCEIWQFK